MKKIVVIGTKHDVQSASYKGGLFPDHLACYARQFNASIIMQEWRLDDENTVGKQLADSCSLFWHNAATPNDDEHRTYDPSPTWTSKGDALTVLRYGPIKAQIKREDHMLNSIETAMETHSVGVFICGLAHLHSISEKLYRRGFTVEGCSYLPE